MKIIGKNSVSTYIAYLLLFLFAVALFHLVYEIIGHLFLAYKYNTDSKILSNTFILANDVGWTKNQWPLPMEHDLKFRINYPFTDIQLVTGIYSFSQTLYNILGVSFLTLFFFFAYKCFKEMSQDQIFNNKAIKWLKSFSVLNLIFGSIGLFQFFYNHSSSGATFLSFIMFIFFGITLFFVVAFFKKGLELQNETDLTI